MFEVVGEVRHQTHFFIDVEAMHRTVAAGNLGDLARRDVHARQCGFAGDTARLPIVRFHAGG
jgi:hypothetical protein